MSALRAASLLLFLGVAFHSTPANAETEAEDDEPDATSRGNTSGAVIASADDPNEIVVTAIRRGEAEVAAQTEFNEQEIASHGADGINDLLARLSPFIGNNGEEPVLLINGKPAGFDRSILFYPAEALERLAILKPEAAVHYGEAAGKPVVNLVLKKHFSMLNGDLGFSFATAGGQYGGTFSAGRSAINGDMRWHVQAQLGADSALSRAARNVRPREGVFDSVGFVSAPDHGEIDAALSGLSGKVATVAAIPPIALSNMPGLIDFAATAQMLHAVDPNRYETLESSRRTASLNIGVTHPLGDFNAALSLNVNRTGAKGRRGLPMASIVIPAGNPWSPFAGDVVLTRPFAGDRALHTSNDTTSLSASMTLNGKIGGWRTGLTMNYSRNWADNFLESGVDTGRIQQYIDAAGLDFNPYGTWDDELLPATRSRTRGENLVARLNVQRAIVKLPAGPMALNLTAHASRSRSGGRQEEAFDDGEPSAINSASVRHLSGQATLSVPISRRGRTPLGWLGDLTVSLSTSAESMTNSKVQKRFGGTAYWTPWPILDLRGSIDFAGAAPTSDQLNGPIVSAIVRIFDYARSEIAEPVWISGGNPDLRLGRSRNLTLVANLRPLGSDLLTLNLNYRQLVAEGGIASFPELTPAIEAAFPDRITRDAEGRLVAIDARAINLARETDSSLSTGIALRLPGPRAAGSGAIAADPLQFSISLNHRMRLKSELLARPGVPAIDQLRAGGQSRHRLSFQASLGKRGIGANLIGTWSSAGRLRGQDEIFTFKPPLELSLSAFIEPGRLFNAPGKQDLLNGLKLSVDINDLLNGYRRVTREDGTVPAGYSRNEIDPLGRTVRLRLSKKF